MNRIIFILFLLFQTLQSFTQGCSDAGLCTVPAFRSSNLSSGDSIRNMRSYGLGFGMGDHSIISLTPYLSSAYGLQNKFGWSFKIDASLRSGNSISTFGAGDAVWILDYRPGRRFTFSGGFKLRLNRANKEYDLKPLPMDYQPSLGTNDLLFGMGYRSANWQFILGYQHPITHNDNFFNPDDFPSNSILSGFINTYQFRRKSDIMLRISRLIRLSDKLVVTPGILPIYHLGNDTYVEPGQGRLEIEGSEGLTLNATALFEFTFKKMNRLGISIGFPLVVRDVRPDGLTRSFVIGIDYQKLSSERTTFFGLTGRQQKNNNIMP